MKKTKTVLKSSGVIALVAGSSLLTYFLTRSNGTLPSPSLDSMTSDDPRAYQSEKPKKAKRRKKQLESLELKNKELSEGYSSAMKQNKGLRDKIKELQQDIKDLKTANAKAKNEIKWQNNKIEGLIDQVTLANNAIIELANKECICEEAQKLEPMSGTTPPLKGQGGELIENIALMRYDSTPVKLYPHNEYKEKFGLDLKDCEKIANWSGYIKIKDHMAWIVAEFERRVKGQKYMGYNEEKAKERVTDLWLKPYCENSKMKKHKITVNSGTYSINGVEVSDKGLKNQFNWLSKTCESCIKYGG